MNALPRRGPQHRVSGLDFSTAEAVLKTAALVLVPEDQSQRQAFGKLMPHLYVLRNKGCSFGQLAKLLTELGFNLQLSVVRNYYNEMLVERQDICQERMNEQILLMAEIRKETHGADVAVIAGRVASIMATRRAQTQGQTESKVRSVLGVAQPSSPQAGLDSSASPPARPQTVDLAAARENKKTGLCPVVPVAAEPVTAEQGFGLLNTSPASQAHGKAPMFFHLDDDAPAAPARAAPLAQPPGALRCGKLQAGIPPLKKKPHAPDAVYTEGLLEHPAIAGLMLTLAERVYGASLEIIDAAGELRLETLDEKRFRITWKTPVPMTATSTSSSFTKMDESLFAKR
jgi:hypothetical protein